LGIYTGKDLVKKKASTNRKEGDGRGRVWVEKQAVKGKDPKWRPHQSHTG
jgi:hypothetical protein